MQWIFVLCGCMFLLSLTATYQVCSVSLKAGQSIYNASGADGPQRTFFAIPWIFFCGPQLTGSVCAVHAVTLGGESPPSR